MGAGKKFHTEFTKFTEKGFLTAGCELRTGDSGLGGG
jgi:hypothetical protein